MNFRNNFFQNNNMPGGYQGPMGSNYNNQLHGRSGFSMRNANIPMPNNMYPAYNNQGNYPPRISSRYPASYGAHTNYNNNANMPGYDFPPVSSDMYGHSRALETNNRRARYNINAEPIAKERRRLSYAKDSFLSDSYNYDDYHDDSLRGRNYRKNYKSRFFTKLAGNKKLSLEDLEDERDTEFYSSREDKLRKKRKAKDIYEDDYEDYEDEDYEDERSNRNKKAKRRSKSRYDDEEYDDYEDEDYEDERSNRNKKAKRRSKSRYDDEEYDDYEDDVYDSMNRRPRFVSGPIDFFKKKRRV